MDIVLEALWIVPLTFLGIVVAAPLINLASDMIWKQIFTLAAAVRTSRAKHARKSNGDGIEYAVTGLVVLGLVAMGVVWYFGRQAVGLTPRALHDIFTFR